MTRFRDDAPTSPLPKRPAGWAQLANYRKKTPKITLLAKSRISPKNPAPLQSKGSARPAPQAGASHPLGSAAILTASSNGSEAPKAGRTKGSGPRSLELQCSFKSTLSNQAKPSPASLSGQSLAGGAASLRGIEPLRPAPTCVGDSATPRLPLPCGVGGQRPISPPNSPFSGERDTGALQKLIFTARPVNLSHF